MVEDFGSHPTAVTDFAENLGIIGRAQFVISQLEEWTATRYRDVNDQFFGKSTGEIRYQPKGVIGNIVRKIFSFQLLLRTSLISQPGIFHSISHLDRFARC